MSMCQRLYSGIPKRELPPGGESLARTVDRIVPYWRRRSLTTKLMGFNGKAAVLIDTA